MSGSLKDVDTDIPDMEKSTQDDDLANSDTDNSVDENRIDKEDDDELDIHFKYSNDTSDLRLIVERKPLYVSRVVLSLVSPIMKR